MYTLLIYCVCIYIHIITVYLMNTTPHPPSSSRWEEIEPSTNKDFIGFHDGGM